MSGSDKDSYSVSGNDSVSDESGHSFRSSDYSENERGCHGMSSLMHQ